MLHSKSLIIKQKKLFALWANFDQVHLFNAKFKNIHFNLNTFKACDALQRVWRRHNIGSVISVFGAFWSFRLSFSILSLGIH